MKPALQVADSVPSQPYSTTSGRSSPDQSPNSSPAWHRPSGGQSRRVTFLLPMAFSSEVRIRSAASFQPMWRSIISAERIRSRGSAVLARVFGRGAVVASKHATESDMLAPGAMPMPAHLRGQRVGDVVAIEVERGHHRILRRAQQDLLQEGIGNAVLDDDFLARLGVGKLAPWAAVDQPAPNSFCARA